MAKLIHRFRYEPDVGLLFSPAALINRAWLPFLLLASQAGSARSAPQARKQPSVNHFPRVCPIRSAFAPNRNTSFRALNQTMLEYHKMTQKPVYNARPIPLSKAYILPQIEPQTDTLLPGVKLINFLRTSLCKAARKALRLRF